MLTRDLSFLVRYAIASSLRFRYIRFRRWFAKSIREDKIPDYVYIACETGLGACKGEHGGFDWAVATSFNIINDEPPSDIVDTVRSGGLWWRLIDGMAAGNSANIGRLILRRLRGAELCHNNNNPHVGWGPRSRPSMLGSQRLVGTSCSKATVLMLASTLAACSTFRGAPPPPVDATSEASGLASLHEVDAIKLCLAKTVDQQTDCRDQIVQARMVATDAQYRDFRQWFYGEARWGGFGATVVSLALTGTAAVSGIPISTARALSAIASGVTGTRAAFDKEILADRAATAIESSMDAARKMVAVRIRTGLARISKMYPLAEALSDLEDYYSAGTLLGALANISTLTGVQAADADQQLITLARGGTLTTAPSRQRITQWLRPNGALDPNRRTELEKWLKMDVIDVGASDLPWGQMLVDPPGASREEMRQRAINDLKIP